MKTVSFEQEGKTVSVSAEEILFALGRVPNTASLGLENAGVKTESGRIVTNDNMQTSAPHIYAAGDCTGPHEIVHIAIQQGETAVHNIVKPNSPRRMDYRLLISVVFTEPQVAFVGLTEKEAAARKIPFLAASYPFNDHGKSLIMEAKDGFVKLLAESEVRRNSRRQLRRPGRRRIDSRNRRGDGQAHDRSRTRGDAALSSDACGNLDLSGGGTGGKNIYCPLIFFWSVGFYPFRS